MEQAAGSASCGRENCGDVNVSNVNLVRKCGKVFHLIILVMRECKLRLIIAKIDRLS